MNDVTIQHYADRPAFPVSDRVNMLGLTRLEYFAAHAPTEIPEWFVHSRDEIGKRPIELRIPALAFSNDRRYQNEWDVENDDWYAGTEITPEHIQAKEKYLEYYRLWEENQQAARDWDAANEVTRYFQWRHYYAQKMIRTLYTP